QPDRRVRQARCAAFPPGGNAKAFPARRQGLHGDRHAARSCKMRRLAWLILPVAAWAQSVQLSPAEVETIVNAAALAVDDPGMAVVVVDRPGNILAVFRRHGASDAGVERALSLART